MSWEPPPDDQWNGVIVQYVIHVAEIGGENFYLNVTFSSTMVTSLSPYTTYWFFIAAETSAGRGPFSSAITVQTDEAGYKNVTVYRYTTDFPPLLQLPVHLHKI